MPKRRGTSKSNGRKDAYDRFYTKGDEANRLVRYMLDRHQEYRTGDFLFIEPSAGTGSFVKALHDNGIQNVLAYDLMPATDSVSGTKITKCDFMSVSPSDCTYRETMYDKSHIVFVGNPPFGIQGNLSIAFVNHCLELGNVVWFILPPTFQKESYLRKVPHGIITDVIKVSDDDYTLPDGSCRRVPSAFIEFSYVETKPQMPSIREYADKVPFVLCDRDTAEFSIRRVGGNAGKASQRTDVSEQSNYFGRLRDDSDLSVADVISVINGTDFPSRDWSVGPRSISKRELLGSLSRRF